MIKGNKPRKINRFLFIDRCGEGFGFSLPKKGEKFIGIPYSYYEDTSQPHIEVYYDGKIIRTINCADISQIEFGD